VQLCRGRIQGVGWSWAEGEIWTVQRSFVRLLVGAREDNAFFGSDGDFVGVKSDRAAIVTELADR
jgi:hypothetical protein